MRKLPACTAGMKATEKRLFTPSADATPPALAGREQEQKLLGKGAVLRLKQGKPKQTSIE